MGAQGLGDIGDAHAAEQSDGEIAAGGHGLRGGAGADLAAILIERDIADMVEAIFDAPVVTQEGEETRRVRLGRGQAGDGVGDLQVGDAGLLVGAPPLDPANLLEVGPRLPNAAGIADAAILGGISQGPEDTALIAPMPCFGRGVDGDGQTGAALLPCVLLPDGSGQCHGRIRREREQRGKRRWQYRLPARADSP